jgi:hypothetical protein
MSEACFSFVSWSGNPYQQAHRKRGYYRASPVSTESCYLAYKVSRRQSGLKVIVTIERHGWCEAKDGGARMVVRGAVCIRYCGRGEYYLLGTVKLDRLYRR